VPLFDLRPGRRPQRDHPEAGGTVMTKPVCVPCERFMRPKRNGFSWIEGMPVVEDPGIGKSARPGAWKPYKLWISDLWHCPSCNAEVIVDHALSPIDEHYRPSFEASVAARDATLLVKDC
jgi:hypothetical protein